MDKYSIINQREIFTKIIKRECPEFKFHTKLRIGSYKKFKFKNANKILARCKCKECNIYKKTTLGKFVNIYKFQVEGYDTELIQLIDIYNEIIEKNDNENFDINKIEEILNIIDLPKRYSLFYKDKLGSKGQIIVGLLIKINSSINYLFNNLSNHSNNNVIRLITRYNDKINFIINKINSRKETFLKKIILTD